MIKTYIQLLKKRIEECLSLFKKAYRFLVFKYIKRKAFKLHKKYNCQVFVVKFKGKITIISKYQFKQMRQRGKFSKDFTATELKTISLYYTPKQYDKKRISRTARPL
jgi:hypothetical protein